MELSSGDVTQEKWVNGRVIAVACGVCAVVLGLIPEILLFTAFDEGPRGRWVFADLKNWVGLARFAFASFLGLGPCLWLANISRERARGSFLSIFADVAVILAIPMIPGTVIQVIWWIAG